MLFVNHPSKVLKEGDIIIFRIIGFDEQKQNLKISWMGYYFSIFHNEEAIKEILSRYFKENRAMPFEKILYDILSNNLLVALHQIYYELSFFI